MGPEDVSSQPATPASDGVPSGPDMEASAPEVQAASSGAGASTRGGAAALPPEPEARRRQISRGRRLGVDGLIGLTTLLLIVGCFSVWANRLLFSPDNWANTSTQLLTNPAIRGTTANYIVDQIYANVNVAALLRSGLPTQLQPLAAPAAGALRTAAVQGVEAALQRPRVQALWAQANRAADKVFIAVVNGGKGAVQVNQGVVTLDLGSIVDNVASRLGLPANLSAKLPANIANLTVFKSDQLKFVQNVGNAIRGLALWLTILVPVLYALAIALARGFRRRTLMYVGFAGILGGAAVILGRSILQNQLVDALTTDASLRPTVTAVIAINTQILGQIAGAVIVGGLVLAAAAWLGGPARAAVAARRAIAPFLNHHPVESYAITLACMVLIFIWDPIHATGTPAGIIVFTVLALLGTYALRRETELEFPDARPGETTQALRGRMAARRQRQERPPATAPGAAAVPPGGSETTTPQQLAQLAELHDRHALTEEEYASAKAQLLHG